LLLVVVEVEAVVAVVVTLLLGIPELLLLQSKKRKRKKKKKKWISLVVWICLVVVMLVGAGVTTNFQEHNKKGFEGNLALVNIIIYLNRFEPIQASMRIFIPWLSVSMLSVVISPSTLALLDKIATGMPPCLVEKRTVIGGLYPPR
jgi:hypothetical protein